MIRLLGTRCPPEECRETARRLLAFAVFQAWGWTGLPPVERGRRGKPFFPGMPERQFSLSHSGGLVLCALSDRGAVGADIERVRPHRRELPAYVMSEGELAAFDGSWEDFARVWALKEAYVKCLGGSIFPPREAPAPPPLPHRCYAGEGWRAALCCAETADPPPAAIQWISLPPAGMSKSRSPLRRQGLPPSPQSAGGTEDKGNFTNF